MFAINTMTRRIAAALGLALAVAGVAQAQTVGTTLPFDGTDATTGNSWIGFGASGKASRTPVIFLHGNDGTPYPTSVSATGVGCGRDSMQVQKFAQYFVTTGGYALSEVWALGYQGDQCDLIDHPANSSGTDHTVAANVKDLSKFVSKVLASTGASKVDIVAHGMGAILTREWVRQDRARTLVRRFVAIEAPNRGMLLCATKQGDPLDGSFNPFHLGFLGGYKPDTPVCKELGAPKTPLLAALNAAKDGARIMPKDTLVIFNTDQSYMFMAWRDDNGVLQRPYVPEPYDREGNPTDFRFSANMKGANELMLTGQGGFDTVYGGRAHVGIANSDATWSAALQFLR